MESFPLTNEDKDLALKKAREVVEYYSQRRKREGKKVSGFKGYETRNWYVGFCAEYAIARALNGRVGEGEEFGSYWDIEIPTVGKIQVKCTKVFGLNPFQVRELRGIIPYPGKEVWLTYYYRDTEIRKVTSVTWGAVFQCPKEGRFYKVPVSKELWDSVA